MSWIQVKLKPDSPKVKLVAALVGEDRWTVYGKLIGWFHYVDANFCSEETILDRDLFNLQLESPVDAKADYFTAMSDPRVNWIRESEDGQICVVDYEGNFSTSAKRRLKDSKRKADQSAKVRKNFRKGAEKVPQSCGKNAELHKRREEKNKHHDDCDSKLLLSEMGIDKQAFNVIDFSKVDTDRINRLWATKGKPKKPQGYLVNALKDDHVPERQPHPKEILELCKSGYVTAIALPTETIACRDRKILYNEHGITVDGVGVPKETFGEAKFVYRSDSEEVLNA
ncbi:hypothetical protein KS4_18330 [Poriferisphaera corsica]|uniref:Uncharacterized protein n=1 Tax=Poriferisphaera corsica TaxID=2528020 RepID=A0A517YU91_9BACT|nr:hypothetical protein [Poriferisphaera corsica]QDU33776.1 hypothetical protein KS4_18330 [Poriferisphaera corsica]